MYDRAGSISRIRVRLLRVGINPCLLHTVLVTEPLRHWGTCIVKIWPGDTCNYYEPVSVLSRLWIKQFANSKYANAAHLFDLHFLTSFQLLRALLSNEGPRAAGAEPPDLFHRFAFHTLVIHLSVPHHFLKPLVSNLHHVVGRFMK